MGSFNSNILPASDGLNLGSIDQKWDAFLQTLTIDGLQTASSSPSETGTFKLGSDETIGWRNNADDADLLLSKDTTDALTWQGVIKAAGFTSTSPNVSSAGTINLGASDSIQVRNIILAADMNLLSKDAGERAVVGSFAGCTMFSLTSTALLQASQTGFLRFNVGEQINWRNFSNTDDQGISTDNSDRLSINTINGLVLLGTNPDLYLGPPDATAPKFKRNGTAVNITLGDGSAKAPVTMGDLTADTISTTGSNVSDLSTQSASIGATVIGGLNNGLYAIVYYLSVSRAATTSSSILVTFSWQSGDSPGQATASSATLNSNTLADYKSGVIIARVVSGNFSYTTTYASSGATSLLYHLTFKAIRIS